MSEHKKYFGKYRGTVVNNVDPEQRGAHPGDGAGRLRLRCSPVGPCPPFRSADCRWACSAVPMIGSGVWVEFEQGDLDYPIWTGVLLGLGGGGSGACASDSSGRARYRRADRLQNGILISDVPGPTGGIMLTEPPAR